jgi:hypothetical protein
MKYFTGFLGGFAERSGRRDSLINVEKDSLTIPERGSRLKS